MSEENKVEQKVVEVKVEATVETAPVVEKTAEELLAEAKLREEAKAKKSEIYHKIADQIQKGADKADQLVDKRKDIKVVKEVSSNLTLGIMIFTILAFIKEPTLGMYLILAMGIAFSPKIIKMIFKK